MRKFFKSRAVATSFTFVGLAVLIILDLGYSEPLNPYSAPAAIALGSDEVASGAFCALVPSGK